MPVEVVSFTGYTVQPNGLWSRWCPHAGISKGMKPAMGTMRSRAALLVVYVIRTNVSH